MNDKRKIGDIRSRNSIVNGNFDYSSNENISRSPVNSLHISPMKRSEIPKDGCFICKKFVHKELIDCKICSVKGNN